MPDIKNERIAAKLLPIIYVLDTSGSMRGDRISAVNEAMNNTMDVLRSVADKNTDAQIMIGILSFASGAQWITKNGLIYLEDFFWNDLDAGGLTDFGSALNELNDKLSRQAFLQSKIGYKLPVIIFMSDGDPTDDWRKALEKINQENKWFREATKIGIAVGNDAKEDVLAAIAGSPEAVISVNDMKTLEKLIRVVSVTASKIGSMSRTNNKQLSDIIRLTNETLSEEKDDEGARWGTQKKAPENVPEPDNEDDPWDEDDWK